MTYIAQFDKLVTKRHDNYCGALINAPEYIGEINDKYGIEVLDSGCNFAVRAKPGLNRVEFLVQSPHDINQTDIIFSLNPSEKTVDGGQIYSGFIPDLQPGDIYMLRVDDPDRPDVSGRNLVDPYAKAMIRLDDGTEKFTPTPYSVVYEDNFEWEKANRVEIDPRKRVIYETHIKSATIQNQDVPEHLRGTYLGFCDNAHIEHLKNLGITTVEILPVQQFLDEPHLRELGKTNYWGYNTVGFFAPHDGYASSQKPGAAVAEFKQMVKKLHQNNIEVVLDVVYNHTAEGGQNQPAYSLRALDDCAYYRIDSSGNNIDYSGCGNTIDTSRPAGLELVRDSLRYWSEEMGVDGFRFDLAAALTRDTQGRIDVQNSWFVDTLKNDPILKDKLLIAEPWDIGGYISGDLAEQGIQEWSGKFRDTTRDFWLGNRHQRDIGALAAVMAGSFRTKESINFVTAHDGFSMNDLVSYNHKNNFENGEENRDGTNDNRSFNHGVEGPTNDLNIIFERHKSIRNLIVTTLLSYGTPMLTAGDEMLHSKNGNNNTYCQDNELNWIDYEINDDQLEMLNFIKNSLAIRAGSALGDKKSNMGPIQNSPVDEKGVSWPGIWGEPMSHEDWVNGAKSFGMYVSGLSSSQPADSLLTYVNGDDHDIQVTLPKEASMRGDYELLINSASGEADPSGIKIMPETFSLKSMSAVVLRRTSCRLPNT